MDIQGLLLGRIENLVQQAKQASDGGQHAKAAGLYQQAAVLQHQYASRLAGPEAKKAARERAEGWEALAQVLLTNPPRPGAGRASAPAAAPGRGGPVEEAPSQGGEEPGLRSLVEGLIAKGSAVTWEDIAGLEEVKREVKMAFGLAFATPPVNSRGQKVELPPWRRILLYGPPGTGKTMLAAAVAGQIPGATFFDAKWSGLASKWFGESERIVQLLYSTAKERSPAVVFLDEVDAMASSRETGTESGAAKKVLSAALTALDGVSDKGESPFVLTFAATNRPWSLDAAFLSRFGKAIYVPLPDQAARARIFAIHLERKGFDVEAGMDDLARLTEGYSGRDLAGLCSQVIVNMVYQENPGLTDVVGRGVEALRQTQIAVRPITRAGVEAAMRQVRPTVSPDYVALYTEWRRSMGY